MPTMHPPRIDRIARRLATGTNRRRALGGVLAAVVGVATAPRTTAGQEATPTAEGEGSWLYVQAFAAATLAPDPATLEEFRLTLTGLDEAVLAFTETPDRKVRTLVTADFASHVTAVANDPLNATLAAPLADGEPAYVVVQLVAVEHDPAAGSLGSG